jgi:hypothetical protein
MEKPLGPAGHRQRGDLQPLAAKNVHQAASHNQVLLGFKRDEPLHGELPPKVSVARYQVSGEKPKLENRSSRLVRQMPDFAP